MLGVFLFSGVRSVLGGWQVHTYASNNEGRCRVRAHVLEWRAILGERVGDTWCEAYHHTMLSMTCWLCCSGGPPVAQFPRSPQKMAPEALSRHWLENHGRMLARNTAEAANDMADAASALAVAEAVAVARRNLARKQRHLDRVRRYLKREIRLENLWKKLWKKKWEEKKAAAKAAAEAAAASAPPGAVGEEGEPGASWTEGREGEQEGRQEGRQEGQVRFGCGNSEEIDERYMLIDMFLDTSAVAATASAASASVAPASVASADGDDAEVVGPGKESIGETVNRLPRRP